MRLRAAPKLVPHLVVFTYIDVGYVLALLRREYEYLAVENKFSGKFQVYGSVN